MKRHAASRGREEQSVIEPVGLRIIGGTLRGRKLAYSGDTRTRPMKDRVREAVFNLLGPAVKGSHTIDLFAGTGALGLEALSRGAARATFIERHLPTLKLIEQNVAALGMTEKAEVVFGDAFLWTTRFQPVDSPLLTVFCSPPYDFYIERREQLLDLIARWMQVAPTGSQVVIESDERLDLGTLPDAGNWNVRTYSPAVVAIHHKRSQSFSGTQC